MTELTKAFDFKALGKDLEQKGLPALEVIVEVALSSVIPWATVSFTKLGGLYTIIGIPALAVLGPMIKTEVDKIDGQPG